MQFKIFKKRKLIQGISDVSFSSMRGKKGKKRAVKFLKSLGYKVNLGNIIWAEQVFGSKVYVCKKNDGGKTIKNVDGLLTNNPGQILAIFSADCLPILLFDPKRKVVAALHGSRASLCKGIIKNALAKMVLNFHCNPREILVGIGPHIRKCHYWLRKETYQNLKKTKFKRYFIVRENRTYFDLTKLAFDDFLSLGIKRKNIEDCGLCTFCQAEKYFSARKEKVNPKFYREKHSRFASFIGN